MDSAVRSIRVASTLNDRFGAILREVPKLEKVSEIELRIGEAQQIYPEIWRHLDEARAELVRRGHRVDDYDAVRATEHPGQQAVRDIESASIVNPVALAFGSLEVVDFKTAKFNAEGHAKARDACNALMQAMPDVDWRALAQQEDAQIAEMGSLAAAKWRNVAIAAVVVLGLIIALRALA
jgi:hypothetical protein